MHCKVNRAGVFLMTAIKELVAEFITNTNYTDWDHKIASEWMTATRCGETDSRVMTCHEQDLRVSEQEILKQIKESTLSFTSRYFDDRPNAVRSLDALFAEFGMDDEAERRKKYFQFERIYHRDEVIVLLLKHLQSATDGNRYTRAEIADFFLTSEKTINTYIALLRPSIDPGLRARVFGQAVQLNPDRGTNKPDSTTHPLFLPLNMVELYTLVDMLVKHVNDPIEGRIVESLLGRVLDQTTGYAEERLGHIDGFDDAQASIAHLDNRRSNNEAVMFHEKEGIRATVRYINGEEEKTCTGYISRNHKDKTVVDVTGRGEVFHIPFKDIINLESAHE